MNQSKKMARPSKTLRAKDACDFTVLFEKHFDLLLRKTREYVKDVDAAKDIVQESLANVWDNRIHRDQRYNMRAYLERACVNRALNYLRDRRKFSGETLEQCTAVQSESPHTTLTYLELHDGLMHFVQHLPDHMRSTFLLSRFQNMSYKEISRNLGISVVAVEKTMMKALKQVREFISRSGLKLFLFFALSVELKTSRGMVVQQPVSMASLSRRSGN